MKGVIYTGVPSKEELLNSPGTPSEEIMATKKVPRIECVQQIPCNPCEGICPTGAIFIGENITNLPVLTPEKCSGCGLCVANCPGLAITIIDKTVGSGFATIDFPFEYLPLPNIGDIVKASGRDGEYVCDGEIINIRKIKAFDKTTVITIKVPVNHSDLVVSMKRLLV